MDGTACVHSNLLICEAMKVGENKKLSVTTLGQDIR